MLTIIFKTGETQNKDGKQFKSKRKNAKLESDELCPQNSDEDKKLYSQVTDNTRGVCELVRETQLIHGAFQFQGTMLKRSLGSFYSHKRTILSV